MSDADVFQSIRRDGAAALKWIANVDDLQIKNDSRQSLLHVAIAAGNRPAIESLLTAGIDVHAVDENGQTALHYAAAHNNLDAAEQILLRGGDASMVDLHGNTALWTAVFNARGRYDMVTAILNHGGRSSITTKNKHGKSPLDFAQQIGDEVLVSLLQG